MKLCFFFGTCSPGPMPHNHTMPRLILCRIMLLRAINNCFPQLTAGGFTNDAVRRLPSHGFVCRRYARLQFYDSDLCDCLMALKQFYERLCQVS
jgi:hypothetical protein